MSAVQVFVTDFGAQPDSGEDCTQAVRNAIDECHTIGSCELVFPTGRYDFKDRQALIDFQALMSGKRSFELGSNAARNCSMSFKNLKSFTLDGQGSLFVFHGLTQPLSFDHCQDVTIRNVYIDWERPLFTQGTVVKVNDTDFEFAALEEFPLQNGMPVSAMLDYDPHSPHPIIGSIDSFHAVERTELIAPGRLRVFLKRRVNVKPGTHLVLRHINNYRMGILLYECTDVTVENVTLYSNPGMGLIGHRSENIHLRKFMVRPAPETRRVMSTNTDATHFISCRGTVSFSECYFEGMGDDAANVHSFYQSVEQIIDPYSVLCSIHAEVQSECLDYPDPGNEMEFVRPDTLLPFSKGSVDSVQFLENNRSIIVKFQERIPKELKVGDLLANTDQAAAFRFTNSVVRNNRARALLVQTRDALIENNVFDHCTGTAVHVNCAAGWAECLGTEKVVIRNNRFLSCGYGAGTYKKASAIAVTAECPVPAIGVHKDISIERNWIVGEGRLGIQVSCAEEVRMNENRFEQCSPNIKIDYCRRVIAVCGEMAAGEVAIGEGNEAESIHVIHSLPNMEGEGR